jgi:AcrR family transcriptional regulator
MAVERRSGPAPGATREEVLAVARERFLACERVDVRAIAAECGVGRATVYRWFGSRENLVAEAMVGVFEARVAEARGAFDGEGVEGLLDGIGLIYAGVVSAPHLRTLVEREPEVARRVITSSAGEVHPRVVALIRGLLDAEIERGSYEPPIDPGTLAYVLVRLAESALFHYDTDEYPRDLARMREVQAALLGA